MSDHAEAFFYSKNHRKIQERFSAVGLADGALRYNVRAFLDPEKREIIQTFFQVFRTIIKNKNCYSWKLKIRVFPW